jgi:hypothetical protein
MTKRKYRLELRNPNSQLDLSSKQQAIEEVFRFIYNGGSSGRAFVALQTYRIVKILRRTIVIEVCESSNPWHRFVGKFLANRFGMRAFCDPKDKTRMFNWVAA